MRSRALHDIPRVLPLIGLLVLGAVFALPGHAVQAVRLKETATPAPGAAPTFAIQAPLFGQNKNLAQGPVGTYVQVGADPGSGWTPTATITLSVTAESQCGAAGAIPVSTKQPITVGADQSFKAVFQWPGAANQGPNYLVCATESGTGVQIGKTKNIFIVLASSPPAINVSPLSVPLGGSVQVSGTNFLPVAPIKLWLQHPGKSFAEDQGDAITADGLQPDGNGSFNVTVKLPADRSITSSNDIVATIGDTFYQENGQYPISAVSQPLTFTAAPTPTPGVTPTAAPTTVPGGNSTGTTGGGPEKLLVGLLGLIAVVLLLAGVIVAVLALRGRNTPPDAASTDRRPSGGYGGGYMGDGPLDQTIADADWQGRQWEDERWQSPPGRPWSGGRVSSPYTGRNAPPPSPFDDEDDDRYRTRMGDPYQAPPPPPPTARPPYPPQSRPMPPRSNPRPTTPNWNGDENGQDTGPAGPWPPRQ